jgi:GT2 family glycosyltransferase
MFSEEMDLCKSITEAEWKILLVPRAMVVHYGSGSTSQVAVPMFARRYESKYVYFAKHDGVLTANAFRFVVIPVYCVVRLLLFPSIWLITRKRYRDSNLSPLMYLNLLRDIFKWSSSEQVALTEGGSYSSV